MVIFLPNNNANFHALMVLNHEFKQGRKRKILSKLNGHERTRIEMQMQNPPLGAHPGPEHHLEVVTAEARVCLDHHLVLLGLV